MSANNNATTSSGVPSPLPPDVMRLPRRPVSFVAPRQNSCCGSFKKDVHIANFTTIVMPILIPVMGLTGIVSVVGTMGALEKLMSLKMDTVEMLEKLEHEAWTANLIIGVFVAILTAVPIYGARKNQVGMLAFGIVLLLTTAFTQYLVGALYIKKANEIVCRNGYSECSNQFRQPVGVFIVSFLVVALFVHCHIRLIQDIIGARESDSSETGLELDVTTTSVATTPTGTVDDDTDSSQCESIDSKHNNDGVC